MKRAIFCSLMVEAVEELASNKLTIKQNDTISRLRKFTREETEANHNALKDSFNSDGTVLEDKRNEVKEFLESEFEHEKIEFIHSSKQNLYVSNKSYEFLKEVLDFKEV